jgi:hypothetical protein
MVTKRIIPFLLVFLFALQASAQEPTTPALGENSDLDLRTITLADLVGSDPQLVGLQDVYEFWVSLPHNWEIKDAITVDLVYTASQILTPDQAVLTISVNNQYVWGIHPIGDGQPHSETFTIPPGIITESSFKVEFRAYLPVTTNVCELSGIGGQWLRISRESTITLATDPDPAPPQLETLVRGLVPSNVFDPSDAPLVFVLPSYTDPAALSAAAQIAYRVGMETSSSILPEIVVRTVDNVTEEDLSSASVVLIGLPDANAYVDIAAKTLTADLYDAGTFLTFDGVAVPPGDGVLHVLKSLWNPKYDVLIVSGNSQQGVQRAGYPFIHSQVYGKLIGNSQFISGGEEFSEEPQIRPWTSETTTLKQTGNNSRTIYGFSRAAAFWIERPLGQLFGKGTTFTLKLTHSPLLEGSNVRVLIDDIVIGSADTGPNGVSEYTFDLPVEELNAYYQENPRSNLKLSLAVSNLVNQSRCQIVYEDMQWTTVDNASFFIATYVPFEMPNVNLYPYPFVTIASDIPTTLVLPPSPTGDDLRLAMLLATSLGRYSKNNDLDIDLIAASAIPDAIQDHNLIVLGDVSRQQIVNDVSLNLQQIVYQVDSEDVGMLEEMLSPFDDNRTLLLVTGNTFSGYDMAVQLLLYTVGSSPVKDYEVTAESDGVVFVRVANVESQATEDAQ